MRNSTSYFPTSFHSVVHYEQFETFDCLFSLLLSSIHPLFSSPLSSISLDSPWKFLSKRKKPRSRVASHHHTKHLNGGRFFSISIFVHESGFVETVPFEHRKLWWFQIPQVLLQGARHSRSTPFAGVGVATSTRHPLSGAFPAAPAAAPQRRAGAQAREHQARPDLRPRQGECCKSSRGNYRLACRDVLVKLATQRMFRLWWISVFESKGISFERKFSIKGRFRPPDKCPPFPKFFTSNSSLITERESIEDNGR